MIDGRTAAENAAELAQDGSVWMGFAHGYTEKGHGALQIPKSRVLCTVKDRKEDIC